VEPGGVTPTGVVAAGVVVLLGVCVPEAVGAVDPGAVES
jgi:hypothetical protein